MLNTIDLPLCNEVLHHVGFANFVNLDIEPIYSLSN